MTRKGEMFRGVTVALLTPFSDGKVDEAKLRKLVDDVIEAGVEGLAPCGTTGESPTLSHDEHDRVIDIVCEQSNGRAKVMAGTGSNSTKEAIRLTKHAQAAGADGGLVVSPYYNKPMQEGFYEHYKAITEETDLPLVVYNIPGRSAKNIEADTINRLGEIDSIVAVKEATGSMDQASQILAGSNLTVLSGDDSLTLPLMSMGGSGVVSVVGNIVPGDVKGMVDAARDGKWEQARELHFKLFSLCRDMLSLATNPIPVKAAYEMLGHGPGALRLPLTELSQEGQAALKKTLTTYGLL
ncbi:MAG: 4-hydroxy-tetrahydrodipicolinate synthase [Rubinisphaera brasiliensis]|uniref:4-hydroxy-tetrahydrodipicolinate synthase n=1 Tax=Rubinisphaera brasiliensis (strain ATCC 49424 / DSM 5305 / JCM 21570 / IAM 15109 / NBRC 103401 / IFAM 1448) TaxID=756272 RepID=F0SN06_RUBBR|nr:MULTISPECIES: 4-hydroxy-tetrahydrodipicolinate synthase [Rubinisphaera]ADY60010.1 dihydrodipicolinate synthase [Rubinisphaera brasiliensis DSM 5305]MBR9804652.1 4-hydroxy-tetrahydrodipicolinate synthase [bacterium]